MIYVLVVLLLVAIGLLVVSRVAWQRQRDRIKELETLLKEKLIAELNGSRGRPF